jgi:hypothetical protein
MRKLGFAVCACFMSLVLPLAALFGSDQPAMAHLSPATSAAATASPVLLGSYDTPGRAMGLAVSGEQAYIADGRVGGLQVVNVADPTAPSETGADRTLHWAQNVAVRDQYAYVADLQTGLHIFDVSNPASPNEIGVYDTPWDANDVALVGAYAYVADGGAGLQVIDISDPTSPQPVSSASSGGYAAAVAVASDYAYVAYFESNPPLKESGLLIVNVSDPLNPVVESDYPMSGKRFEGSVDVAVAGDYAYVANTVSGLHIVDISNPSSPVEIGNCPIPGEATGVTVNGDDAFVAAGDAGLRIVDVSQPANPIEVSFYETSGYASDVLVVDDIVYVADGVAGLLILGYPPTFSISGRVVDSSSNPIEGVQVAAGAAYTATTDTGGHYTLTEVLSGTYTLTPTKPDWVFTPRTRILSVPPDGTGQDFTILHPPISTTLSLSGTVSLPGTLAYEDTQELTTTLAFPSGAVTESTTIVLTPTVASASGGFVFAGHAFDLEAYQESEPQSGFTFNEPVTITIHYSAQDVRLISNENDLTLRWWDGSVWQDAAETCDPPSTTVRDPPQGLLRVPICHLSRFALLGTTNRVYLPLVLSGR